MTEHGYDRRRFLRDAGYVGGSGLLFVARTPTPPADKKNRAAKRNGTKPVDALPAVNSRQVTRAASG